MRRRGKILYLKLDTEMIRVQLNGDIYNDAYKCMFVNGIHAQMPNDTASDRFGGKHVPMRIFLCHRKPQHVLIFPVMPDTTPNLPPAYRRSRRHRARRRRSSWWPGVRFAGTEGRLQTRPRPEE